jgi:hypothetical protein
VISWFYRESICFYLFLKAAANPTVKWRQGRYRLMWGGLAEEIKEPVGVDNPTDVKLNMSGGAGHDNNSGTGAAIRSDLDTDYDTDYDDSDHMDHLKSSGNANVNPINNNNNNNNAVISAKSAHARKPSMPKFTGANSGVTTAAASNVMVLKSSNNNNNNNNNKKTVTSPSTNHKRTSSYSVMMMRSQSTASGTNNNSSSASHFMNHSDLESNMINSNVAAGSPTTTVGSNSSLLSSQLPHARYNSQNGSNGSINSVNSGGRLPPSYSLKAAPNSHLISHHQHQHNASSIINTGAGGGGYNSTGTSYHSQLSLNLNSMSGSTVQLVQQQHSPDSLLTGGVETGEQLTGNNKYSSLKNV